MSGIRRTEDLHTLKTRNLIMQDNNGYFPVSGAVLAAANDKGTIVPTRDLDVNSVSLDTLRVQNPSAKKGEFLYIQDTNGTIGFTKITPGTNNTVYGSFNVYPLDGDVSNFSVGVDGIVTVAKDLTVSGELNATITGSRVTGAVALATAADGLSATATIAGSRVTGAVALATAADGLSATATIAGSRVTGAVALATAADGLSATATIAGTQITGAVATADGLSATATIAGTQVTGNISGDAASITGTITGSQVTGNISGDAASITGTITGSQVTGNISGDAASITGTITGSQVSGDIAGNASGIINPVPYTWRYYAPNGLNGAINPGPSGTDGQGSFVIFNTVYTPISYPISLTAGTWACPIAGVYLINLNITGFADQPNGGLALSCSGRTQFDFCLFSAASINQNINTVAIMGIGDNVILSGTDQYTRLFSGVPGNVNVQNATLCITLLTRV